VVSSALKQILISFVFYYLFSKQVLLCGIVIVIHIGLRIGLVVMHWPQSTLNQRSCATSDSVSTGMGDHL